MIAALRKKSIIITIGVSLSLCLFATYMAYRELSKKQIDRWIVPYSIDLISGDHPKYSRDETTDLIFLIADHHEHSFDNEKAKESVARWIDDYKKSIEGITDSNGRNFQYTWFYPYDNRRTPGALHKLSKFAEKGYGEVELHWHKKNISDDEFKKGLNDAVEWFGSYGALVPLTSKKRWKTAFGYVAGNWDLDNGLLRRSGSSNEIDHLINSGAYADFTFPNSSDAQPPFYSSIYYAQDDSMPRSHFEGTPARVGGNGEGLMIFMGPTGLDFKEITTEFGTIEAWWYKNFESRIDNWFDHAPVVEGRPEWRFVKTYTHGVQSRSLFESGDFRVLLEELVKFSDKEKIRLHFVTAREAYNIVKAAEDGKGGNPFEYRNYEIPEYVGSFLQFSESADEIATSDDAVSLRFDSDKTVNLDVGKGRRKATLEGRGTILVCGVRNDESSIFSSMDLVEHDNTIDYYKDNEIKFSSQPKEIESYCKSKTSS